MQQGRPSLLHASLRLAPQRGMGSVEQRGTQARRHRRLEPQQVRLHTGPKRVSAAAAALAPPMLVQMGLGSKQGVHDVDEGGHGEPVAACITPMMPGALGLMPGAQG